MKMFDAGQTRMIGLPYGEKNCDDMLSRFHLIPERHRQTDGRTDGRTDGQNCYINIGSHGVSVLTRDKNENVCISSRFKCKKLNLIQIFSLHGLLRDKPESCSHVQ